MFSPKASGRSVDTDSELRQLQTGSRRAISFNTGVLMGEAFGPAKGSPNLDEPCSDEVARLLSESLVPQVRDDFAAGQVASGRQDLDAPPFPAGSPVLGTSAVVASKPSLPSVH